MTKKAELAATIAVSTQDSGAPGQAPQALLIVMKGNNVGTIFELDPKHSIYVIGREDSCDIQVVDGEQFRLRTGDSIHYLGRNPHSWSNPGDRMARLLWTGKMLHGATPSAYVPQKTIPAPQQDRARPVAAGRAADTTAE